jgi:nucleotide-binding universal stress UspA family protein
VRVGDPAHELRDATSPADVVVVGRRGIGLVERVVLGSTSVALAGSSRGPVVIVPDDWATDRATDGADGGHVVAGVDGTERDNAVLEFAFARADRDHLPLDVVAAAELPAVYGWETTEVERWVKEAQTRLGERMEPWVHRFPSVDLRCHTPLTNPAIALLDAAEGAALIVVGRYAGSHHLSAFSGLSTARRVLHHAACPVAVVPVGTSDPETFRFDETDVPQF